MSKLEEDYEKQGLRIIRVGNPDRIRIDRIARIIY
jgi:hypothetical protein